MEKWFIKNRKDLNIDYEKYGLNKILYRIALNRGIESEEELDKFLHPTLDKLYSPILLKDMVKSANLILSHISKGNKIRIVGDYDVDGVTSTFVLMKGLKNIGAIVDYDIPHRVHDGYGINNRIIDQACEDDISLIITCDNGIAAFEPVLYGKSKGIDIIITDHHEVPKDFEGGDLFPEADGVIDPKRQDSQYPFYEICGCTVAFKVITYLYLIKGKDEEELYQDFLPYVTIATICDVMPLKDENRILVSQGLLALRRNKDIGLCALIDACDIKKEDLSVYHIGFILGPTINSSGRLESAEKALELFLSQDPIEAKHIATTLRTYNRERQDYTEEAVEKAEILIKKENLLQKMPILVLYIPNINESIVGIVAGRLKEKYCRPTIVLTDSKGLMKGSGRSIKEYNMFEEISKYKSYLTSFGGHAMAAGLSLGKDQLVPFIVEINNNTFLTKDDLVPKRYIDMELPLKYINYNLIEELKIFEPYGNGNETPQFGAKNLLIENVAIFGKNKNVIKLQLKDKNCREIGLLFEDSKIFLNRLSKVYGREAVVSFLNHNNTFKFYIDILYYPGINTFRGNTNIELKIKSYRIVGE
ncbi:MAG: single-stranded-DNA-specific exonuclease RecJ [Tissierellia bacterium]|nr:single-stranded-DNA-specific exonuclease RecJ [Tissierellia bacterium]